MPIWSEALLSKELGEANMKIGFQGIPGAYSEMAARSAFDGCRFSLEHFPNFEKVFLKEKQLDFAIIPIENSGGSIHENYDHLLNHNVGFVGILSSSEAQPCCV